MMTVEKAKKTIEALKEICGRTINLTDLDEFIESIETEETILPFLTLPIEYREKATNLEMIKKAANALKYFRDNMGVFGALAVQQGFHLSEQDRKELANPDLKQNDPVTEIRLDDQEWWKWFAEACRVELGVDVSTSKIVQIHRPEIERIAGGQENHGEN